jgi:hypothetical protein
MGTNKNVVVSFSIAILLLLSLLLLLTYNSKCNQSHNTAGPMMQNSYNVGNYSKGPEPFYFEKFTQNEPFAAAHSAPSAPMRQENYANGRDESFGTQNVEPMADLASVQMSNEVSSQWSARANQQTQNAPMMSSQGQGQGPAGSFNGDSSYQPVSNMGGGMGGMGGGMGAGAGGSNQQGMQSCFPRDRLTADDLLPKDAADSKWAQINPSGGGNISDQNYLTAGYHVGVNTVGQSLRNANLQLRSEIPNPQDAVGPWMISTIEPDLRQNTLEIGSSISY